MLWLNCAFQWSELSQTAKWPLDDSSLLLTGFATCQISCIFALVILPHFEVFSYARWAFFRQNMVYKILAVEMTTAAYILHLNVTRAGVENFQVNLDLT